MRRLVLRASLGFVVAGALLSPATASASSLVYLKAGDVYLGAPDGSLSELMRDRLRASRYTEPDDDGTP